MGIGLIGLLDDVAGIAKVAAASLDDVAGQAAKAGAKAAGVVIDDTAVTPGYVIGFEPKRELPIVGKIAAGSLRNKLMILLPVALVLSYFLPWMITPLLMVGGAYLCYEGVEKVLEAVMPHRAHQHEAQLGTVALNAQSLEDEKVASAIKTDFILSAEIMAITLAAIPTGSIWKQALVLAVVAIGITAAVYGVVALIVKADDVGMALAKSDRASAVGARARTWHRSRHARASEDSQRGRHCRHDLGWRRHHPAWRRGLRSAGNRPRRQGCHRGCSPRIPAACRDPRMGGRGSHIRRDRLAGRCRIYTGRRICLRACMEIAEARHVNQLTFGLRRRRYDCLW